MTDINEQHKSTELLIEMLLMYYIIVIKGFLLMHHLEILNILYMDNQ